jgi:VanZ family protein
MIRKITNIFFSDKEALRTVDSYRIMYLVIAVIAYLFTEAGRMLYRPYIYSNQINDFGFADTVANLGGIIFLIFLLLAILNLQGNKAFYVIGLMIIGYILYEVLQPYMPKRVFDWKDIFASFIGATIALIIVLAKEKIIRNNRVIYKF